MDADSCTVSGFPVPVRPDLLSETTIRLPGPDAMIFGTASTAGLHAPVSEAVATDVFLHAVRRGVRYVDTAPQYGAGLAETRLGKGLATLASMDAELAQEVKISTKVGKVVVSEKCLESFSEEIRARAPLSSYGKTHWFTKDQHADMAVDGATAACVKASWRQSKQRLGVDAVECLRLHQPNFEYPTWSDEVFGSPDLGWCGPSGCVMSSSPKVAAAWAVAQEATAEEALQQLAAPEHCELIGGMRALVHLKHCERACKEVSLGFITPSFMERVLDSAPPGIVDNVMLANAWNPLSQKGTRLLRRLSADSIPVHLAGCFASGVLWHEAKPFNYLPANAERLAARQAWVDRWCGSGLGIAELTLWFAMLPAGVDKLCFGADSVAQVEAAAAMWGSQGEVPGQQSAAAFLAKIARAEVCDDGLLKDMAE